MPGDAKPSLLIRLIQGGGKVLAVGAPLLGIPVLGSVGSIVEKMPLAELEEWVRMRRGTAAPILTPPDSAAAGAAPDAVPEAGVAEPPAAVAADLAAVSRQLEEVAHSGPVLMAVLSALKALPLVLERFLVETYAGPRDARFIEGGVGLWPAFTLEWVARRHFADALGNSAAVEESPDVRALVEVGLAREAVDLIMQQAEEGGVNHPMTLGDRVLLFSAGAGYKWPEAAGYAPGYVVAHVGDSGLGSIGLTAVPPSIRNAEAAGAARDLLVTRLGQLSVYGRSELTRAWLGTCEALRSPEVSGERRAYLDRDLPQLNDPILAVADPQLRDVLRGALSQASRALAETAIRGRSEDRVTAGLKAMGRAYAAGDRRAFEDGVRALRVWTGLPTNQAIRPMVEEAIAALAQARGWAV